MKKSLLIAAVAAIALVGCQKAPQTDSLSELLNIRLSEAKTFEDSVIAIDGTFIGGAYSSQVPLQGIENPDRNEMLRGLRDMLGSDTENRSYLAGVAMGLQVINVYRELSEEEPISKEKLYSAIAEAFRLDSISPQDLQELQPMFRQTFAQVKEQAQKRKEAEIFNSKTAKENRIIGEAVAEKYQSDPEFSAIGDKGLMVKVITEGDGEVINPNNIIIVSCSESHAESGLRIRSTGDTPMYAGHPDNPVLASVIPFMSIGETAQFLVPYELAYGVIGNENLGVGPCEYLLCTVTVKQYASEK